MEINLLYTFSGSRRAYKGMEKYWWSQCTSK